MPNARRVGAAGRSKGGPLHAVWVEDDTTPYVWYQSGGVKENHQKRLATGQIREMLSECGVFLPNVVAGSQGGHDWDRIPDSEKCINCRRALGELE